ncbi:helix-turn-helix domain-containing protein [Facklamia sp. P12955]|uniref:helix-turn-helix domain-containing protein n=1 Tax=Facklamia sp. P12955 TaxID=3421946 RepID=UPI003D182C78
MKPDSLEVGARISRLRKSKQLTMVDLGKKIGAGQSAISNWERGDNLPNKKRLAKLSEIFNITVEELLYGSFENYFLSVLYEDLENKGVIYSTISNILKEDNNQATKPTILSFFAEKQDEIISSVTYRLAASKGEIGEDYTINNSNLLGKVSVDELLQKTCAVIKMKYSDNYVITKPVDLYHKYISILDRLKNKIVFDNPGKFEFDNLLKEERLKLFSKYSPEEITKQEIEKQAYISALDKRYMHLLKKKINDYQDNLNLIQKELEEILTEYNSKLDNLNK